MKCKECRHSKHVPAECKQCNCGEAEIAHLKGHRQSTIKARDRGPAGSTLTMQGYDCGHRVKRRKTDND